MRGTNGRSQPPARSGVGLAGSLVLSCLALVALSGCEGGILDVDDSGVIVPADLDAAGPSAIPTLVNGAVGAYHEAVDGVVRYTALLTDEMILAGTFPTRFQVDARRIQPSNADVEGEMYTPLHRARLQADTVAFLLEDKLDDPDFAESEPLLREGIAIAKLYAGFTRLWLGESYCWSILTGLFPESAPVMPDDRVTEALAILQEAEGRAAAMGLFPVALAALIGQARAHLWLGDFDQAAAVASLVPRGFVYRAEYSGNNAEQYNGMYTFTWGDTQAIRWTVGDGTAGSSGGERWEHLEEFLALGLLRNRPPGFTALSQAVPVVLQMLYNERGSDIFMASWTEAALIRAEIAVRSGQTGLAEELLNDLRADYSLRATIEWGVNPPPGGSALLPIQLSGDFEPDLARVVAERARELWLTGDRLTTGRRLKRDPQVAIDLFPPKAQIGGGEDIAFPIPQIELDNNPELTSGDACPAGQSVGSWS